MVLPLRPLLLPLLPLPPLLLPPPPLPPEPEPPLEKAMAQHANVSTRPVNFLPILICNFLLNFQNGQPENLLIVFRPAQVHHAATAMNCSGLKHSLGQVCAGWPGEPQLGRVSTSCVFAMACK